MDEAAHQVEPTDALADSLPSVAPRTRSPWNGFPEIQTAEMPNLDSLALLEPGAPGSMCRVAWSSRLRDFVESGS